jgi:hypothetical protein
MFPTARASCKRERLPGRVPALTAEDRRDGRTGPIDFIRRDRAGASPDRGPLGDPEGRVLLGPNLDKAMKGLRKRPRRGPAANFTCLLILPDDQILYTSLTAPTDDPELTAYRIEEGLEGMTPYAVSELVYDWRAFETDRVKLAVVARETLDEARGFAESHGFTPAGFAAMPPQERFPRRAAVRTGGKRQGAVLLRGGIAFGPDTFGQEPEEEAAETAAAADEEAPSAEPADAKADEAAGTTSPAKEEEATEPGPRPSPKKRRPRRPPSRNPSPNRSPNRSPTPRKARSPMRPIATPRKSSPPPPKRHPNPRWRTTGTPFPISCRPRRWRTAPSPNPLRPSPTAATAARPNPPTRSAPRATPAPPSTPGRRNSPPVVPPCLRATPMTCRSPGPRRRPARSMRRGTRRRPPGRTRWPSACRASETRASRVRSARASPSCHPVAARQRTRSRSARVGCRA